MKKPSVLPLVVFLVAVGELTGQPLSRLPGPIRVEVTLVMVPAIVLDRDGWPVSGLRLHDFEIMEDGVPQDPFLFSPQSRKAKPQDSEDEPSPPEPDSKSDTPRLETSPARTFLLVLDNGRQQHLQPTPLTVDFLPPTGMIPADGGTRPDEGSRPDLGGWYLLGYIPQNKAHDGGYRQIEVEVRRDGLRVEHRSGYYADGEMKPESGRLLTQLRPDSNGLNRF